MAGLFGRGFLHPHATLSQYASYFRQAPFSPKTDLATLSLKKSFCRVYSDARSCDVPGAMAFFHLTPDATDKDFPASLTTTNIGNSQSDGFGTMMSLIVAGLFLLLLALGMLAFMNYKHTSPRDLLRKAFWKHWVVDTFSALLTGLVSGCWDIINPTLPGFCLPHMVAILNVTICIVKALSFFHPEPETLTSKPYLSPMDSLWPGVAQPIYLVLTLVYQPFAASHLNTTFDDICCTLLWEAFVLILTYSLFRSIPLAFYTISAAAFECFDVSINVIEFGIETFTAIGAVLYYAILTSTILVLRGICKLGALTAELLGLEQGSESPQNLTVFLQSRLQSIVVVSRKLALWSLRESLNPTSESTTTSAVTSMDMVLHHPGMESLETLLRNHIPGIRTMRRLEMLQVITSSLRRYERLELMVHPVAERLWQKDARIQSLVVELNTLRSSDAQNPMMNEFIQWLSSLHTDLRGATTETLEGMIQKLVTRAMERQQVEIQLDKVTATKDGLQLQLDQMVGVLKQYRTVCDVFAVTTDKEKISHLTSALKVWANGTDQEMWWRIARLQHAQRHTTEEHDKFCDLALEFPDIFSISSDDIGENVRALMKQSAPPAPPAQPVRRANTPEHEILCRLRSSRPSMFVGTAEAIEIRIKELEEQLTLSQPPSQVETEQHHKYCALQAMFPAVFSESLTEMTQQIQGLLERPTKLDEPKITAEHHILCELRRLLQRYFTGTLGDIIKQIQGLEDQADQWESLDECFEEGYGQLIDFLPGRMHNLRSHAINAQKEAKKAKESEAETSQQFAAMCSLVQQLQNVIQKELGEISGTEKDPEGITDESWTLASTMLQEEHMKKVVSVRAASSEASDEAPTTGAESGFAGYQQSAIELEELRQMREVCAQSMRELGGQVAERHPGVRHYCSNTCDCGNAYQEH